MSVNETLGFLMLLSMVAVIFIGFPISFTLLFLALVFGGVGLGWNQTFNLAYLQIWGTMKDEIFPAVPLFIFMGFMTEQAGLMERLFGALRSLLAPVRGALYLAVLFSISIDDFLYAISIDERSSSGAWTPILWPLRGVIPLTAFMLFVQGISELMKSLWAWRTGVFLTVHEKIEV